MAAGKGSARRPTMWDVAREVGVSQSLVSMVFRDIPGPGEETRRRILATAAAMGYVRNEPARSLRSQRPTAIGVVFRTHQPFHDEIVDALYAAVAPTPHDLMLSAVSDSRSERTAVEELIGHRCGAVVLIGPRTGDEELAGWAGRVPLVVVARRLAAGPGAWVLSDDDEGMRMIVEHLVGFGHHDIVYFSAALEAGGRERLDALGRAVAGSGDGVRVRAVPAGITEDEGAAAVASALAGGRRPTAIIAFNDRCALGVMEALHRRGLRVPQDVSLVGYDDSSIAARSTMDLTSVHQDTGALASIAASRATARIAGDDDGAGGDTVPVRLVVRSSTGPAPQDAGSSHSSRRR